MTGRATATILFTDLVGSTELRGRLGEEAAEQLRRTHDRVLVQVVEAHSGRVVKGLGDGLMATFAGASDGVAAAVAIQQAIDRLNRSGKAPLPLAVRVGLSAGDVTFEDDDVHGTPVIEASRLCGAAGGGGILASELVRGLAGSGSDARFVSLGPLELKGLGQAVPAVGVEWEPLATSTVPLPTLLTDMGRVFVGRDAELERLGQLWKEAAAGERRVALLAGEPGVGKTRLAAELATGAHEQGAVVLAGRCDEDLGVPYQPFVEALRHFADNTPPEELADRLGRCGGELVRLMPELSDLAPGLPPPLHSDPETERYRLFDAVGAWLSAASSQAPVLLVLDDLQWAAKPMLLLLRHVVHSVGAMNLLIVGTYRDTELAHDHPLAEVLADLRRTVGVERLSLGGLDSAAVVAFTQRTAGEALSSADVMSLACAIHEETEGNPFFIREVLRHLIETGALQSTPGAWASGLAIGQLGIPEGVRDVVGRRLSRLSQAAYETLAVAAVIGPEFDFGVLATAGELEQAVLLGAVDEATVARLVAEVPGRGSRYRFSHALVRDTLYGDLSSARRVTLHRRVAEAIEAVYGTDIDSHLPALAHHWDRAWAPGLDPGRAVAYLLRAGDRALSQLAPDEAIAYCGAALELLQASGTVPDDARRLELLISLGKAQRSAGDADHRHTLLEAAALARQRGDAHALARAALENIRGSMFSATGIVDLERVGVLQSAVDTLGENDQVTRARLLAALGVELHFDVDRTRRVALSDEALAVARRSGDPGALAHVLAARYYTIFDPATLDEREANTRELLSLANTIGDPVMSAWAHWFCWRVAMETTQIGEAQLHLENLEKLASGLGQPTLSWGSLAFRSGSQLLAGRFDEAERLSLEAATLGEASGTPDATYVFASQRFGLRFEQGRLDEVRQSWLDMPTRYATLPLTQAVLAVIDGEVGRCAEAEHRLDELAVNDFDDVPLDTLWPSTLGCAAVAAAAVGATSHSVRLYELLKPFASQLAGVGELWLGSVSHYLAILAATIGRNDDAETHFAAAAATHDRIGAPAWLARTRVEWARMLLTRRGSGDDERARELLNQALATARELGLGGIERQAVALLGELA